MRTCRECGMFVNDGETHTPEICIVAQIHEYEEPHVFSMGRMIERARVQIQEEEDKQFIKWMMVADIMGS